MASTTTPGATTSSETQAIKYAQWIDEWLASLPTPRHCYGMCATATTAMAAAFPELTRVPGWVLDGAWGQREHWWLTAPEGYIVDPTAAQFPCILEYRAFQEGDHVRIGRCMQCGDDILGPLDSPRRSMCSDACGEQFDKEMYEDIYG